MNNWRLLLLALVAVIQPIASYTERNLVDGRHQCCDRQSRLLLRDSRESLYGPNRFTKDPEDRRLSQRDEINKNRRSEINHYASSTTRLSSDFSLLHVRAGDTRRAFRQHLTKDRIIDNDRRHIRSLDDNRIVRTATDAESGNQNRRIVREFRGEDVTFSSLRLSRNRDVSSVRHLDERSSVSPSKSRRTSSNSQDLRKSSPISVSRKDPTSSVIARNPVDTFDATRNRQQVRDRLDVVRPERPARVEMRRNFIANNDRRFSDRRLNVNEDRRLLSPSTRRINEIRDVRLRINSRNERRELYRDTDELTDRFNRNSETLRGLRDHERRFNLRTTDSRKEIRNDVRVGAERMIEDQKRNLATRSARIRQNKIINDDKRRVADVRKDIRNTGIIRKIRSEITDNERRFRENSVEIRDETKYVKESRRLVRNAEALRESPRDNKRGLRDSERENRRAVTNAERLNEVRNNERYGREIDSENRREIRRIEVIRELPTDFKYNEVRIAGAIRDSRRESRNNERSAVVERRARESISATRREIRDTEATRENRREINNNDRRFRDTSNQNKRNIRSTERLNEVRGDEKRGREKGTETRRFISSTEAIRESRRETRNNEMSFRESSNDNRRELRSANRVNQNWDDTRRVKERNSDNLRETSSDEAIRSSRLDTKDNERRSRERASEVRKENRNVETTRTIGREARDNARLFREIRNNDRRFTEIRASSVNVRDSRYGERLPTERNSANRRDSRSADIVLENRRNNERTLQDNLRLSTRTQFEERRESRHATDRENRKDDLRESRDAKTTDANKLNRRITHVLDRDNALERRSRSIELGRVEDKKDQLRLIRSDTSNERDLSRIQIKVLNDKTVDRETLRLRNVKSTRIRENEVPAVQKQNDTVDVSIIANWQYVFYTLQGIYLCGFLVQMITPSNLKNCKTKNWWPLSSENHVKVD